MKNLVTKFSHEFLRHGIHCAGRKILEAPRNLKFHAARREILACASYDLTYVPQNFNACEIIKFASKFKLNQFKESKRLFKF